MLCTTYIVELPAKMKIVYFLLNLFMRKHWKCLIYFVAIPFRLYMDVTWCSC